LKRKGFGDLRLLKGAAMNEEAVVSSSVAWVGYEATTRVLVVGFRRGTVYEFLEVPEEEHRAFMSAASKGRRFNQCIRGRYAFRRRAGSGPWN
jgi:hypothetical protein